jgi:phosphatidylserine/phosphatidylglycerophosphate/cardiolipin synthase-like enzyme
MATRRLAGQTVAAVLFFIALAFAGGYFVGRDGGFPRLFSDASPASAAAENGITCYFSPRGGCTAAIVAQLDAAGTSIHLQAYSFTSKPIAQALLDAKKRGVQIIAVLDSSQRTEKYSEADFINNAAIPTYIDSRHAIAHNKIMLIDGKTIITGSFNFTNAAESSNAENLLIIHDHPRLYGAYESNFQKHLQHSERYGR